MRPKQQPHLFDEGDVLLPHLLPCQVYGDYHNPPTTTIISLYCT